MTRLVTCILNDKAGSNSATRARELIGRIAAEHGAQARVVLAGPGDDIAQLARDAVTQGGTVAAGGGDGTLSAVAGAVAGTDIWFGVLPMGTLNHFAKDLNIPLDLEEAVRLLFTGQPQAVDVGEVNGRVFLNNSSIGLYPQIVRERESQQRHQGRRKWVAFARAATHVLRRAATLRVELDSDGGRDTLAGTPFVFIGNNRYAVNGLEIGKRDSLAGGRLWVCAAPHAGRLRLLVLAAAALVGRLGRGDLAEFETGDTLIRTRRRRLLVATDGEVTAMRTPLHYRIRPGALQVIMPAAG